MGFRYGVQVRVDDDIHEVGGFDDAAAAATAAHVEASHFGGLAHPRTALHEAISSGQSEVVLRDGGPRITVLVH